MKVNFSLPKTQLMQIAASCTDADVGGGRSFAPGSTRVNYNLFLRRVEAVLKVDNRSHRTQSQCHMRTCYMWSQAALQENLREGSDILRSGGQDEAANATLEEDKDADVQRKATLAKLCRALSIIDEHDEGLLSLQQLLQVRGRLLDRDDVHVCCAPQN